MRVAFILLFLMNVYSLKSQFSSGDVSFEVGAGYVNYNNLNITPAYGVEVNWFATDRLSIDYNINGGRKYFHVPGSVPLTLVLLNSGNDPDDTFQWGALISLIIPEGVSWHFNVGERTYLTPSLKPFGFELINKESTLDYRDNWYFTNNLGLEVEHFISDSWHLSFYGNLKNTIWKHGVKWKDNENRNGYSFGFRVGRVFSL